MPRSAILLNVFIAAPSDVAPDKEAIRDAINGWNALNAGRFGAALVPMAWETHASPEMGGTGQEIINRQLVDRADVLIAILGRRLGTPTKEAESGTVEEIERVRNAGKAVAVYFKKATVDLDSFRVEDHAEYDRVRKYKEELKEKGLFAAYESQSDLKEQLQRDLTYHVEQILEHSPSQPVSSSATTQQKDSLDIATHSPVAEDLAEKEAEDKQSAYLLLKRGEYEEGMRVLREELQHGSDNSLQSNEAFGQHVAFAEGGVYTAFEDLQKAAAEHPDDAGVQFWFFLTLVH